MKSELKPDRLLAKSFDQKWKASYGLVGHTADVVNAVTLLADILGDRLIEQFQLECSLDEFMKTARLTAYFHDWGKANNHFQGVVRKDMPGAKPKRNPKVNPQLVRHEIFSMFLVWEFREWLQQADGDFMTALAVAGGHHLKLGGKGGAKTNDLGEIRWGCGDDRIRFYFDHCDFKSLLKFGVCQMGCPAQLKLSRKPALEWSLSRLKDQRTEILRDGFLKWEPAPVLTALLKALLVAGDSIGSASAGGDIDLDRWVRDALNCTLAEGDLNRVIRSRLQGSKPRQFQRDLGNITERVGLARAGCGTGKTVGAYYWAKRHAVGRKLFFCYPTTGTSTEGFLDYVQDELKSVLSHSRADVDLELARTGEEEEVGDGTINEAAMKLRSFKEYAAQATVCTVDTVLGLMQCHRRPMYTFPAIANAAFVFDEVHCYDNRLFGALLRFLETVKAPVLLMSASFLPSQLEAIRQAVGEPLKIVEGPKELETQPRYRFQYADEPNWERVEAELTAGGKVLWVCNQVDTAVKVYEEARGRGLKALLYHSRFRYEDRVRHHRDVVDAFKPDRAEPILAVATQVAEMSLDLSATLLLSQIADPAGLIQRLGRLNRRYCGRPLDALFYPDTKRFPYGKFQRDRGREMVRAFSGDVSQADLANWLEQQESPLKPECDSVWLDGEWRTYPGNLRQEGVTVTALLEQNREQFQQDRTRLNLYTVPLVTPTKQVSRWARFKGYPIAPSAEWRYCSTKGAYKPDEIS
ncbi:CRISPR-associated helicase Cas3' [Lyngbya sp. CCY1209]|uniref:CRISPR-associated helicase Cas3' n=1 Tax=Lyngbya sp. CCY1209 TaxID=2886103 RepID=UPI002D20BEDE|nr:CRISPR-associated helicase Cas3' [Lyngbya sp. CCY1209]MEB3884070.1 CRISPR-associated helicase Cas3' [Lyngbya sp. CCY1209]